MHEEKNTKKQATEINFHAFKTKKKLTEKSEQYNRVHFFNALKITKP